MKAAVEDVAEFESGDGSGRIGQLKAEDGFEVVVGHDIVGLVGELDVPASAIHETSEVDAMATTENVVDAWAGEDEIESESGVRFRMDGETKDGKQGEVIAIDVVGSEDNIEVGTGVEHADGMAGEADAIAGAVFKVAEDTDACGEVVAEEFGEGSAMLIAEDKIPESRGERDGFGTREEVEIDGCRQAIFTAGDVVGGGLETQPAEIFCICGEVGIGGFVDAVVGIGIAQDLVEIERGRSGGFFFQWNFGREGIR